MVIARVNRSRQNRMPISWTVPQLGSRRRPVRWRTAVVIESRMSVA